MIFSSIHAFLSLNVCNSITSCDSRACSSGSPLPASCLLAKGLLSGVADSGLPPSWTGCVGVGWRLPPCSGGRAGPSDMFLAKKRVERLLGFLRFLGKEWGGGRYAQHNPLKRLSGQGEHATGNEVGGANTCEEQTRKFNSTFSHQFRRPRTDSTLSLFLICPFS